MKIAVLGGGLSGLALGYLLNQRAVGFELLEKDKECGGLMRSLRSNGFTFDYGGSHVIFSKDKEALNFMLSLLGNNKIQNKRNTRVLYKHHYVKYPFENDLAGLTKEENFECLYYFIQNLIAKEKGTLKKPKNLKEWCYCTFGKGIAEKYLIPYNEKIWKYPSSKISLKWVERIPNPPVEDIIKSSLGIETEGYTHQLHFYYPKTGGIHTLIQQLEEKITSHITTQFEVKKVRKENNQWVVSNGKQEKTYNKIISTIPIQNLITALDSPKKVKNAAKNLKYNSLITVMLGLNTPKVNDLSWLYIPAKTILPHRISFPSNYSPHVAPTGKSSVLAEITCTIGNEIWKTKDETLIDHVIEDLHKLKIINKKDICFFKAKRYEFAYVINDLDHCQNMQVIREYMKKAGIALVGRFAEFEYMNMDACIRSAMNYVKETKQPKNPITN